MSQSAMKRLKFTKGHKRNECCLIHTSPSTLHVKCPSSKRWYKFGTGQVTLYPEYNEHVRDSQGEVDHYMPGYNIFANAFNRHYKSHSLVTFNKHIVQDPPFIIYNVSKPSPTIELLHITPKECIDAGVKVTLPGYQSVNTNDHEILCQMAVEKALHITHSRDRGIKERAAKKAACKAEKLNKKDAVKQHKEKKKKDDDKMCIDSVDKEAGPSGTSSGSS
ncbi:hypothetical protein L218DRAFT_943102 [Marasmius fiardii PR-910]|nr:hypothetical protein L218DRAFT_943102 [Marasmius fiardii PR-910]